MLVTLIVFIAIIGLLVFVHELGHFLAARKMGVKVKEFAFGFKPRIWGKKIGDTTYAINAIPLGGYVHMKGEADKEGGDDSYNTKSPAAKALILISGVLMNFLLGIVLLVILFIAGFEPLIGGIGSNPFVKSLQEVKITDINSNSPAEAAGLKIDDIVTTVNDKKIASDQEFIIEISRNRGESVEIGLLRAGQEKSVSVVPRTDPPEGEGPLGVGISSSGEVSTSVLNSVPAAVYETGRIASLSAIGFGGFIKNLVVEQEISEDVTGIIGVGAATGIARRLGWEYVVQLVIVVSIGLAIVNLVPILPLDGGHLAVVGYEAVTKRKLGERGLNYFAGFGLLFIIFLFVVVTSRDFIRFQVWDRLF